MNFVDHSPGAMTRRARVYLSAAGFRHAAIGVFLLGTPWLFSAAAFVPIFNLLPLNVWGVVMLLDGLGCLAAAILRNADIARAAMVLSAVITLILGAGLAFGIVQAWDVWIGRLGFPAAVDLFMDRPTMFPADLVAVAPAPPSPFLPLVMLAVTIKDFVMVAQPLRVPLEETVGAPSPRPV